MRRLLIVPALIFFALAVRVAIEGIWLIATPDPDGSRRLFGFLVTTLAGLIALVGAALLWASSPSREA